MTDIDAMLQEAANALFDAATDAASRDNGGAYRSYDNIAQKIEDSAKPIANPTSWFWAPEIDSEWWNAGGKTRDEAIERARTHGYAKFCVLEARRLLPNIDALVAFDGEHIISQIQQSEVWGEAGWEGAGDSGDLEAALRATVRRWFNQECDLTGAQLDFINGPEEIA